MKMTHNQLVPDSSPGGTTLKPSKSLTMGVFVFNIPNGVINRVISWVYLQIFS